MPSLASTRIPAIVCCLAMLVVAPPPPAAAGQGQTAGLGEPQAFDLAAALVETLRSEPGIRLALEELQIQRGLLGEAGGPFDLAGIFDLRFRRSRGALLDTQIETEVQRRDLFRTIISELTHVADDLQRQLEEDGPPIADCRSAVIVIDGQDFCLSDSDRLSAEMFDELLRRLIAGSDPATGGALDALRQLQLDMYRQLTQNIIAVLRNTVDAAEVGLERLGEMPEIEEEYTIDFGLRVQKVTRRGFAWSLGVQVDSLQDNYDGKSLIPAFGGKGIPNTFRSFAGAAVHIPLGRGRGRVSVAAPERAAEQGARAARHQAIHQVSESLLTASTAFWRLLAAEQRYELLQSSMETTERLAESLEALIAADLVPAITRSRIQARQAFLAQSLASAELERASARVALAQAMGLDVSEGDPLPHVVGAFPEVPSAEIWAAEDSRELVAQALQRRYDLRAVEDLQVAGDLLLAAARRDLTRQLDLNFAVGYSGLHESFADRYYDPRGFGEALFGRQAGPSAFFGVQTSLPRRDRVAAGRLRQTAAFATQNQVETVELRRDIGSSVAGLVSNLEAAAQEVANRRAAVEYRQEELDAALERFRYGEGTVIETIFSEENLTLARLDVVRAELGYALLHSRLQHELGRLVEVEVQNGVTVVSASLPSAEHRSQGLPVD